MALLHTFHDNVTLPKHKSSLILCFGTTGNVLSIVVDNDIVNRKDERLLAVQVLVVPSMTIEYRNIRGEI